MSVRWRLCRGSSAVFVSRKIRLREAHGSLPQRLVVTEAQISKFHSNFAVANSTFERSCWLKTCASPALCLLAKSSSGQRGLEPQNASCRLAMASDWVEVFEADSDQAGEPQQPRLGRCMVCGKLRCPDVKEDHKCKFHGKKKGKNEWHDRYMCHSPKNCTESRKDGAQEKCFERQIHAVRNSFLSLSVPLKEEVLNLLSKLVKKCEDFQDCQSPPATNPAMAAPEKPKPKPLCERIALALARLC